MNRENIKKVRTHIARIPAPRFAMDSYFGVRSVNDDGEPWVCGAYSSRKTNREMVEGACNTCACIAGHALVALEPGSRVPRSIEDRAAELLELTDAQSGRLFEPNNHDAWFHSNMRLSQVTRAHAVRVLDHLIETGEVDWKSTRRAKKPAVAK